MELETRYNGLVEIDEKEIIEFPQGIPGFIDKKKYVLLSLHEKSPFFILQSVEEVGLAFITLSPWDVLSDYEFEINKSTEKLL
ncbi:MAG: flagellar assembly protein FliW, partial [Halanaerobiales bacterium]